ncbi:hypothetical protein DL93DRAFT_108456 [Clavulina sp. PMI_390]|nr:hypothetical protein DL93DRAFT_108456 [Clavulina sp. PMI_390]
MCSTSALSIDERANKYRFARISHIRSTTGTPNCARVHLTWMQHSSKVLQEAHHPCELFWTSTCSTIEAYRIQALASVEVSENPTNSGTYFARRLYDAEDSSFQSIHAGCSGRSTADITEIDLISSFCPGCEKKSMRGRATGYIHTPLVDGKKRASLRMENLDYHEGDFVYIKDDDHKPISGRRNDQRSESGKLLRIAKLIGIGLVKVEASNGWKYAPRIRVSYFQRDDSGNDVGSRLIIHCLYCPLKLLTGSSCCIFLPAFHHAIELTYATPNNAPSFRSCWKMPRYPFVCLERTPRRTGWKRVRHRATSLLL